MDALLPAEMAEKAEQIGVRKAQMPPLRTFVLAVLAGSFIALGGVFSTTVTAGSGALPYGIVRLLAGVVFSLGLILVVVGGAELFTGNNLIVMAWASRRVSTGQLLTNWAVVYLGNFVGAVATAGMMFLTGQYAFGRGAVGIAALGVAETKLTYGSLQAVSLGVMCNALVCLAVWLSYSARSTTDRILAIVPPIAAFVGAGFEHSVANMYFIPLALFIKAWAPPAFWAQTGRGPDDYAGLTPAGFVSNGGVYWFVYLRGRAESRPGAP